jgi:hypothetical protein
VINAIKFSIGEIEASDQYFDHTGFAAIPTAALDPPHCAASPAVPALIGSGSPPAAMSNRLHADSTIQTATVSISASFWNSFKMSR